MIAFSVTRGHGSPDFSGILGEEDAIKTMVMGGIVGRERQKGRKRERERQYDAIGNFPSL